MTKAKGMLSAEEHKKIEEEKKRPFRLEVTELEQDCVSVKSPIILSREQYNLIQKICDITGQRLEEYIKDALMQIVQIDLDNPTCFGQTVCQELRRQWDPIKPK
jgi:hypothetical protein